MLRLMEKLGYTIDVVSNGQEAVNRVIEDATYDVVFMVKSLK